MKSTPSLLFLKFHCSLISLHRLEKVVHEKSVYLGLVSYQLDGYVQLIGYSCLVRISDQAHGSQPRVVMGLQVI